MKTPSAGLSGRSASAGVLRRPSANPYARILRNTIAYWILQEAIGLRQDSAGLSPVSPVGAPGNTTGKLGHAVALNGTTQYLTAADSATLSAGSGAFMVAAWCSLAAKASNRVVAAKFGAGGNEYTLEYRSDTDTFAFFWNGSSLARVNATTFGSPSLNTPYFVCGWHDNVQNLACISVNAGAIDTVAATGGTDGTTAFTIGARSSANFLSGWIDEVMIARMVPTASDLTFLYNGGTGRTYPFGLGTAYATGNDTYSSSIEA